MFQFSIWSASMAQGPSLIAHLRKELHLRVRVTRRASAQRVLSVVVNSARAGNLIMWNARAHPEFGERE